MIKRATRHNRNRTALAYPNQPPGAAITPTNWGIVAGSVLITFSGPLVLRSLPLGITRQAGGAGAQLAPTACSAGVSTLLLTYAAAVVATDVITIPGNVAEVRSTSGGPIAAAVHTF